MPGGVAILGKGGGDARLGASVDGQVRQDQFSEAVCLLEERHPGHNQHLMPGIPIILDACQNLLRTANKCCTRPVTNQPYAGPKVWCNFKLSQILGLPPAMQRRHTLLADRIDARNVSLSANDRLLVHVIVDILCRGPCLRFGLANDDIKPDAEADLAGAAMVYGESFDRANFCFGLFRRLAP